MAGMSANGDTQFTVLARNHDGSAIRFRCFFTRVTQGPSWLT